jgi:UDP-N-acetyl-D-mannosaminuronic acid transferase (WecB/TagA/CpsF family)
MEVGGINTQIMTPCSSTYSSQSSSMIAIIEDEDEENKKSILIALNSSQTQGIASEHYRNAVGQSACIGYDSSGSMSSATTVGASVNISV